MALKFDDLSDDNIVAEINITPLTDLFLVLLIIFMISSSAIMENGLQVKLPSAKTTTLTTTPSGKPIYVTIAKDGQIAINNQTATDADFAKILKDEVAQSSDKTVIIRGDELIQLGKAVNIMDAARAAGAEKIAIATQGGK